MGQGFNPKSAEFQTLVFSQQKDAHREQRRGHCKHLACSRFLIHSGQRKEGRRKGETAAHELFTVEGGWKDPHVDKSRAASMQEHGVDPWAPRVTTYECEQPRLGVTDPRQHPQLRHNLQPASSLDGRLRGGPRGPFSWT